MMRTIGSPRSALRLLAFILAGAIVTGCHGSAGGLLPTNAGGPAGFAPDAARHRVAVHVRLRIPRRKRAQLRTAHPSSISALTRSVVIAVNGTQHAFNTTTTSPGCSIGASGTVCTFTLQAILGTDTFVVTTYSAADGGGTPLDHGIVTVPIVTGKVNAIVVSLGPVVSTTADNGVGSLRYAVATANAGDTIMFLLPTGATIALATPIDISGSVSLAGPGASGNVAISGGGTHQIFNITGTATISGLSLVHGAAATAGVPGGAILNYGTLTLASDTLGTSTSVESIVRARHPHPIANARLHPHCTTAYYEGGALYNYGALTMSGTTFTSNVVQSSLSTCIQAEGGAIYNDPDGTLSSTGDTFTDNSALIGGAVYNGGTATFIRDTFRGNGGCNASSGCPTSGCTSGGCTSFATGMGAAIYDAGTGVTIVSSTFENNVDGGASLGSTGQGGALFLSTGLPSVTGSTFTGNLAGGGAASCSGGFGGAISATVPVVVDGDTFTNNVAMGDTNSSGGAIAASAAVQGTNVTFTSNEAIASGSPCGIFAEGLGGAVAATKAATFTNSTFSRNSATGNANAAGGAMFALAGATLAGDTLTSNAALGTGAAGALASEAEGGALYLASASPSKVSGSTFTSNTATAEGSVAVSALGAGLVASGSLTSSNNTFTANVVTQTAGTGTVAGGAIYASGPETTSVNDTFKSNSIAGPHEAVGGAVFVGGGFVLRGATFTGNTARAPTAYGGGVSLNGGGTVADSTFTSNAASGTTFGGGGAAYDDGTGATLIDSTLSQNTATTAGGGFYSNVGDEIEYSTIRGNTVTKAAVAGSGGGGIYSGAGGIVLASTIDNNSVTVSFGLSGGGAIFNGNSIFVNQSTLSGNAVFGSAAGSGGGGIYGDSAVEVVDSTITGNSSSIDGGGIMIAASAVDLFANDTVYQNRATGIGGNIDNLFTMTLENSVVASGAAATGPDVDNAGTLTSGDYNIITTPVAGTPLAGTTAHDLASNPQLLALANNGGQTFTNAETATSPGIAHIPFSGSSCGSATMPLDQRGYARGRGGKCDVGAFEYNGTPTATRRHVPHAIHGAHRAGAPLMLHLQPLVLPNLTL